MVTRESANLIKWDGTQKGYFDSYILKLNHVETRTSLWLQYEVMSPEEGSACATLWAAFFDYNAHANNLVLKNTVPLEKVSFSREELRISIDNSVLVEWGTTGGLADSTGKGKGRSIEWDLRWRPSPELLLPLQADQYEKDTSSPKVAIPGPQVAIDGIFAVGGRPYVCKGGPAYQCHLWGNKKGPDWAWANCNAFEGGADFSFDALVGRSKLGPIGGLRATILAFRYRGKQYIFNSSWQALRARSKTEPGSWDFQVEGDDIRFVGQLRAGFDSITGMQIRDVDSQNLWAYRTGVADMKIEVWTRTGDKKGDFKVADMYISKGTTCVEWGYARPDDRLKIHI